jgi:HEAT repeat protein
MVNSPRPTDFETPSQNTQAVSLSVYHSKGLLLIALLFAVSITPLLTQTAQGADDEVLDMLVELVSSPDRDMRMLALEQIREEVPGEAATLRFVALLPKLPLALQVELIDALGERGDTAARPAVLKLLTSKTEAIRIVAASALSGLAIPADVIVLAELAATGSDVEKKAARHSLRQLRGNDMNNAMCAALKDAKAKPKTELIAALKDRKVKEALPTVVKSAHDRDLAVRLAALDMLRAMGDEKHTAAIVKRLKSTKDKSEQKLASLALLALCKRAKAKSADAVIAGLKGTEAKTRILLMRALPLAGGPKSLKEIVARLKDKDKGVQDEAMRLLAGWPDRSATVHLKKLARDVKNLRNHVLALRGLVRLASPSKERAPDLATLNEAMALATRKQEKVLVLGALGKTPTLPSLTLVAASLDQPEIAEDAAFAAVLIAEKIAKDKREEVRAVMQKIIKSAKNEKTRNRAKTILDTPPAQTSATR